jgi:AraC-like DNA-binding protein
MRADLARLQEFPLISGAGLDVIEDQMRRVFGDLHLDAPRESRPSKYQAVINYRGLNHLGLMYGNYSDALDARMGPRNAFVVGCMLSGHGQHRIEGRSASPSSTVGTIVAPGESADLHYKSNFDQFVLLINPAPLLNKVQALTGSPPASPLKFAAALDYERPEGRALRRLVHFLAEESKAGHEATPALVLAELEQAILVSFLCSADSNFSHVLRGKPRSVAPWQVRRAEEYIAANWDQPITVEALAVATNVSARSLFHSFKKARGYSPMALVKQIRLNRAKEMLSNPHAGCSVTNVAYACGFGNLGHFANDYFERFGERPSDTLRSSRS